MDALRQWLESELERRHETPRYVSQQAGIGLSYISSFLNSPEQKMSPGIAEKLGQYFGVSAVFLLSMQGRHERPGMAEEQIRSLAASDPGFRELLLRWPYLASHQRELILSVVRLDKPEDQSAARPRLQVVPG